MSKQSCSVAFVSHGGGPLPLMGDSDHQELMNACQALRRQLPDKPKAIIVVSAHWETRGFSITAQLTPELLYDYSGFPAQAYRYQYGARGAPALAAQLQSALARKNIGLTLDSDRGFDHGVFVPLMLMYPEADIPVLQLSLDSRLSAQEHLNLGARLAEVLPADILVLGSGFTFHNLPAFFADNCDPTVHAAQAFNSWLNETLTDPRFERDARLARLEHWSDAPHARFCHPREEHLIPLLVCAAVAKGRADSIEFPVMGIGASHFFWPVD